MQIEISKLRRNKMNSEIYGTDELKDVEQLAKEIQLFGLQRPITVVKAEADTYRVASGHRRVAACRLLNMETIESEIKSFDNQDDERIFLVLENRYRDKTTSQKMMEAAVLYKEAIETNEGGRAIEKVAEQTGMSVGTIHNGMKAVKVITQLKNEGKNEEAMAIIKTMDDKGVSAAVREANQAIGTTEVKKQVEGYWNMFSASEGLKALLKQWVKNQDMILARDFNKEINTSGQTMFKGIDIFIDFIDSYTKTGSSRCKTCNGYGVIEGNEHCPDCYNGRVGRDEL